MPIPTTQDLIFETRNHVTGLLGALDRLKVAGPELHPEGLLVELDEFAKKLAPILEKAKAIAILWNGR
jgi:hypothetical protein